MKHKTPARPPIDIGGTSLTGMRPLCQERLQKLLGLAPEGSRVPSGVDEAIMKWAGSDFRSVGGIANLPGVHEKKISDACFIDCWGIRKEIVGGEWQITASPLRGATINDLKAFKWPEPRVDERMLQDCENAAKALQRENRYVVIAEHPVYGILELGCWMCGYDDFLLKFALEPDFVRMFFDRVLTIQLQVIEQYYGVLGPYIALTISGDDFGTQRGPFISPEMFREFVAPAFAQRIARTKEIARCYFWHHSCGSVVDLLESLISCGVDILNPIQTSAQGMDPAALKRRFGDRIVFWGAVDVQQFLRQSTPQEVRRGVLSLLDTLGSNGGYVMAPGHEIQDDISPENIVAWIDAVNGR